MPRRLIYFRLMSRMLSRLLTLVAALLLIPAAVAVAHGGAAVGGAKTTPTTTTTTTTSSTTSTPKHSAKPKTGHLKLTLPGAFTVGRSALLPAPERCLRRLHGPRARRLPPAARVGHVAVARLQHDERPAGRARQPHPCPLWRRRPSRRGLAGQAVAVPGRRQQYPLH